MNTYSVYQLPCKTMISCGMCPYRERCNFVHDARIRAKTNTKSTTRKKDKTNDECTTVFYWPKMTQQQSTNSCLYNCRFENDENLINYDYVSVYSMWNHFINVTQNGVTKHNGAEHCMINPYTQRRRLGIFVKLATKEVN